jgi:hypothetical protein
MVTRRRLAGALLAGMTGACGLIIGIDDKKFVPEVLDKCVHADPPGVPDGVDDPNKDKPPIVFAVRQFILPEADSGVGYDLDHVCTCDARDKRGPEGGPPPCTTPAKICDTDGGIDNGGAALFSSFSSVVALATTDLNGATGLADLQSRESLCGQTSMIFILYGYNGEADDPQIFLSETPSAGIIERPTAGEVGDAAGCELASDASDTIDATSNYRFPARFDGTDKWSVTPGFIPQGTESSPTPQNPLTGWVSNFKVVVDIRDSKTTVPILIGPAYVTLTGGVLTADIVAVDADGNVMKPVQGSLPPPEQTARYELRNGVFAGRVSTNQLLVSLAQARVTFDYQTGTYTHLCETPFAPLIQSSVCAAQDIPTSTKIDLDNPSACDALSIVLGFNAISTQIGAVRAQKGYDNACVGAQPLSCP